MSWLLYLVLGLVGGGLGGFFLSKYLFEKQLKENPPISEKQIRTMFSAMGQKPNEARVQQVLRQMGIQPSATVDNKKKKK